MAYPTEGTTEYTSINSTAMTLSGTTSEQIFAANAERTNMRITNNGPYLIFLGLGLAASKTKGIKLVRDATWEMDTTNIFRGIVNGISNTVSAAQDVTVQDGYII